MLKKVKTLPVRQKLLLIIGVLTIISLFFVSSVPILFVIMLTLFLVLTIINLGIMVISSNISIEDINKQNIEKGVEDLKDGNKFKGFIKIIAIPMAIAGMLFAIISLALLWMMAL